MNSGFHAIAKEYALSFSRYTDLGNYKVHFHDLPKSVEDLCQLVKALLIHPVARYRYEDQIPTDRLDEDSKFSSVQEMLTTLLARNANLLDLSRKPSERLILSCRFHSILLASLLKYIGIPCRVRAGFATYLVKGKFIDHWVCEVWDSEDTKWKIVDSDIWTSIEILRIDFDPCDIPNDRFIFAGAAWLLGRNNKIDPMLFGIKKWWGSFYIRDQLFHDIECLKNNERVYTELPVWSSLHYEDMTQKQLRHIDQAAEWTLDPDQNFPQILNIDWTR